MYYEISEKDYTIIDDYYHTPEMMEYSYPDTSIIGGRVYMEISNIPKFAKKKLIKMGTFTEEFFYNPRSQ